MRNLAVGDLIYLRKIHHCGNSIWNIYRVGTGIGIKCTKCNKRILKARRDLLKQIKANKGLKEYSGQDNAGLPTVPMTTIIDANF